MLQNIFLNKKYIILLLLLIIIILLIYSYYSLRTNTPEYNLTTSISTYTTIKNTYTTIKNYTLNFTVIDNIINKFSPPILLGNVSFSNYTLNITNCSEDAFVKAYYSSNTLEKAPPYNFTSLFNRQPITEYIDIAYLYNPEQYNNWFEHGGGICLYNFNLILGNSQHKIINYTYRNIPIRVYYLYNFTNEGLNLTYNQYIGKKPNLYWIFAIASYKNLRVVYGEWGFEGYQNITRVMNEENKTLNILINLTK